MSTILEDIGNGAAGLAEVKDELAAAISEKGVTVPTDQPLASYPDLVREIPAANGNFVTEEELEAKGFITREDLEALPVGGLAIGSIFAYPSAEPPEGAYLLNGQTIYNCAELYPEFWEWLNTADIRKISNETYETYLSQYGYCGAFCVWSSTGKVRLPTYTNAFLMGGDSSNIGKDVAAGLPNITGTVTATYGGTTKVSGAFTNLRSPTSQANGGGSFASTYDFDASLSNDTYGKSDTVQPPAIRVSWCIQVFNVATEFSQQESAQLASQMQMKAQTDLANVTEPVQAFKDMAISWGMPDYTTSVTWTCPSRGSTYTIPYDCELYFSDFNNGVGELYITLNNSSGAHIIRMGSSSNAVLVSDRVRLKKGTVLYIANNRQCTVSLITKLYGVN